VFLPLSIRSFRIASFADLGVPQDICSALASKGIIDAFPIQELTLPLAMAGQDLIGQAKTGTGKTLGFGIPLLTQVISPTNPQWASFKHAGKPQGLVIVPTRELAIQVAADLEVAGKNMGARVLSLYGGKAYEPQVEALKNGVEVIAGTPGRLIDMIKQGHLDLSAIKVLVLDDIGKEYRTASGWAENTFDALLRARFNAGLPTIVTTNVPIKDWGDTYGQPMGSFVKEAFMPIVVESAEGDRRAL
jgi:superfamily II DNA/RNA helicase